jgi:septum formation protein
MIEFILASQSPRRRILMQLVGYPFVVQAADVDERLITHPDPAENVVETAVFKAITIAHSTPARGPARKIIVAADTTVALDKQMLGKPQDAAEAERMLRALRNRQHEVHTGFVLLDVQSGKQIRRVTTAVVTMRDYGDEEIREYVATGNPLDKAGAYAIQHPAFKPVAALTGCYTAVMGLSLCDLLLAMAEFDVPLRADLTAVYRTHQLADHHYFCPIYEKLHVLS